MLDKARSYLGQTFIGTNSSDRGQCVGLVNKVVLDVTGLLYPLQGAVGAKDLITCTNTRPDLFTQVKNDPKNPSQLPSIGDWVIWGSTWGSGYGHVSCAEVVSSVGFTGIEQNFVANKVTRQQHNWSGVIGWVHINNNQGATGMGMTTQADLDFIYVRNLGRNRGAGEGENVYLNKDYKFVDQDIWNSKEGQTYRVAQAQQQQNIVNQINSLQKQVTDLTAQVARLTAENEELKNKPPVVIEKPVDEKAVVTNVLVRFWNSLFKK